MSNYVEYNDKVAFHPGYYVKELVEESGLTQEDFAKRLDTTPKNLSLLIRGKQSLSTDIAVKLSRMTGTSAEYWLNLQNAYDILISEFKEEERSSYEREIFRYFDYSFFRKNFGLPDLPRKMDEQMTQLRYFLGVESLTLLTKRDIAVNFRSSNEELSEENIVKANAMVEIAANIAAKEKSARFNKKKFGEVTEFALTLTKDHQNFYSKLYNAFLEAGVVFVILPNISGSKTNGATKRIGDRILLMVNDRRLYADTFWFTLFHEIGHIMNDDCGISFEKEEGEKEETANRFAEDCLIPPTLYSEFIANQRFNISNICRFADQIDRDPGIVLGRLQNDGLVGYNNSEMKSLRHKYKVRYNMS